MGAISIESMGKIPPHIVSADAMKDLLEIQKVFDHYKVPVFLTFGALLGAYRDGDFIPYDDDIDLCIIENISYCTRKAIGNSLLDIGFVPQPIGFNVCGRIEASEPGYNGHPTSGIIVCQKRIRVTLFFYGREQCPVHGECAVCYPKYGGIRLISTPAHFFDKPETIKFKGHKFLAPSPIKDYLAFTYGDTWRTPIKGKNALQWGAMHPGLENKPMV